MGRAWMAPLPGWLLPRQTGRCSQVRHHASLLTAHAITHIWGCRTESRGPGELKSMEKGKILELNAQPQSPGDLT